MSDFNLGTITYQPERILTDEHPPIIRNVKVRSGQGVWKDGVFTQMLYSGTVLAKDSSGDYAVYEPGLTGVADRTNTTAYSIGDIVVPATPNGYYYVASVAGTSGGSIPTFPTTEGLAVVDGTALTWVCAGLVGTDDVTDGMVVVTRNAETDKNDSVSALMHGCPKARFIKIGFAQGVLTAAVQDKMNSRGIYPAIGVE